MSVSPIYMLIGSHASRPIFFLSCLLAENAVRGAPRYVTRRLIFLVSVNHTPADVRKTKKRKVQAANAKTKQENMASRINVGKQAMKRLLLPMAIFETEGESEVMDKRPNDAMPPDSTVDGNTVKEACTFAPFFSIPKEPVLKMPPRCINSIPLLVRLLVPLLTRVASELTLSVLENHLQMKIKSICDLKTIAAEEATNPYQSKDYTRDTVDPKCKPEHSVECSLAWLLDEFTKAELLVPEDWKVRLCWQRKVAS